MVHCLGLTAKSKQQILSDFSFRAGLALLPAQLLPERMENPCVPAVSGLEEPEGTQRCPIAGWWALGQPREQTPPGLAERLPGLLLGQRRLLEEGALPRASSRHLAGAAGEQAPSPSPPSHVGPQHLAVIGFIWSVSIKSPCPAPLVPAGALFSGPRSTRPPRAGGRQLGLSFRDARDWPGGELHGQGHAGAPGGGTNVP